MPDMKAVKEALHTGAAAGLAAVPLFGGSMSVLFSEQYRLLERKELEKWLKKVADSVDELAKQQGMLPATLLADPSFMAAMVKHARLARETAREEKLQILANAACNSGSWASNAQAVSDYFSRVLERYTPEHLLVLGALDDAKAFVADHGDKVGNGQLHWIMANVVFVGTVEWEVLAGPILRDLYEDGFAAQHYGLGFDITEDAPKLSTPIGHQFLLHCRTPHWMGNGAA